MRLKTSSHMDGVITMDTKGEDTDPVYVVLWTAPGGITVLARQTRSRPAAEATFRAMVGICKRSNQYQPFTSN